MRYGSTAYRISEMQQEVREQSAAIVWLKRRQEEAIKKAVAQALPKKETPPVSIYETRRKILLGKPFESRPSQRFLSEHYERITLCEFCPTEVTLSEYSIAGYRKREHVVLCPKCADEVLKTRAARSRVPNWDERDESG